MSATVGGSIESCSISGRIFPVAADADGERDLGGFTVDVQSNGNGTARILKTRKPWKVGGLSLEVNDDRGDQEFLQSIADGNDYVPITVTLASGRTYQGSGTITDDIVFSTQKATADVTFMGQQKLEAQ